MLLARPIASPPDLLDLHRGNPARYPMLLESSAHGTVHGRWDVLLRADGGSLRLDRDRKVRDHHGVEQPGGFLEALDRGWKALRVPREEPRWPFRGGWGLLLGYELAAEVEPVLELPAAPGMLPVALALRCPAAVLRERGTGECVAVAEPGREDLLEQMLADAAVVSRQPLALPQWRPPARVEEEPPQHYVDAIARVLEYLEAGDVFQANISRGWQARFDAPVEPAALFARLRCHNPAPFAGLLAGDGWAVASASPERLVSVRGEVVETRPIAGTRPRVPGDDEPGRIRELVGHPKERAEHVMLVDLERNDLGRVSRTGSVQVDELMAVESYAHVHHIVSNVRGVLRDGVTPGQVIAATFPGGTITGCPKVRCMQVIAELEGVGRGAYTGSMGWFNRDGDMDLNILIRSAELEGDTLRFRAGAGIVTDSDPLREVEETRAKARGMLRALGVEG